jgi:hypothetical protein
LTATGAHLPRLVAYGADTTPPEARIHRLPGGGNIRSLRDVYGTAYDYNLKEWSLELRSGTSGWQVLAHDTREAYHDWFMMNRLGGTAQGLGDGTWTLRLVVTDTAGLSGSDEKTFTNDWTPPAVEIKWPADGTVITTTQFTITGTASDLNGVSEVRISFLQAGNSPVAEGTVSWRLPVSVTSLMEGRSVTFVAEATDTLGNVGKSKPVTLTFPRFKLDLQAAGRRLGSSLSMFVDPASDIDGDGIDQRWENAAMALIVPYIEMDEEDGWLKQYPDTATKYPVVNFVRITGYTPPTYAQYAPRAYPAYILAYVAFAWAKDWGAADEHLEAHRGDVESAVMAWRVLSPMTVQLEWVRTSAHGQVNRHHGLWNAWHRACTLANIAGVTPTLDRYTDGTELMCSSLRFEGDGRLLLYASENKHAVYPDAPLCSDGVALVAPGYGEDCGWGPLLNPITGNPAPFQWKESDFAWDRRYQGKGRWLFESYNVGEPDPCNKYQLIDLLDKPDSWRGLTLQQKQKLNGLFPNEAVWSGNANDRAAWDPDPAKKCTLLRGGGKFCGGLGPAGEPEACSDSRVGSALGQNGDWTDEGPPDLMNAVLRARYEMKIVTGDRDHAGTDAVVSMALYHDGQIGADSMVLSSAESGMQAPFDRVVNLEQGDTDWVFLDDPLGGEVTAIRLSTDSTGDNPGWFVESIVVRDLFTGRVWAAYPQMWIEPYRPSTVALRPYQPGSLLRIQYEVIVATGDVAGAGTDADVLVYLQGASGFATGPDNLDTPDVDDFERRSLGYYTITGRDVGDLTMLRVQLSSGAGDNPWYCREVTARNLITGQVWVFAVDRWLGGGNRLLTADVFPNK